MTNRLLKALSISHPIIQAPMAGGITTAELVIAVSEAGGLGMIGAGYLEAESTRRQIQEIKAGTNKPFGINLFVPSPYKEEKDVIHRAQLSLKPFLEKLGSLSGENAFNSYEQTLEIFLEQVKVIIEEQVPVCSFTFGMPSSDVIHFLKQAGTYTIGTATTLSEALAIEAAGMDAVVLQGSEAGGHRGHFLAGVEQSMIGLMALIPQTVDQVNIPVIAAGGIMDRRGVQAAQCLGAQAAQLGTAFLTCTESGANTLHKQAILEGQQEDKTTLTKAFSGKAARGIENDFIRNMRKVEQELPEFPIQNTLTKPIRSAAAQNNDRNMMSLWCGQNPNLAEPITAKQLVHKLVDEE
ncbi:NAD(P)H-dependent flavin oxidoreductase [Terribacillus saccharophilus]|uniref:Probable nitronate monooxygenase n=1 Tax=Terribacillus saccharophilus TaxID=361277 RepID=A0ABX4GWG1_9BACI|nr:nitronate monooxygenase [Terribacillus saccharophilus]PAD34889.1 nitronate monooxygenase [Terribacillus saccharophilus]PAD95638.1 nitronate monooxygenase [Terribacillus saccharophilus]PAD99215.1 nitronate monooxygenase [Terribacillus saccharophilus]